MLGKVVHDKVTGFEGVCTSRTEYLYGPSRCGVEAIVDGEVRHEWFEEGRLEPGSLKMQIKTVGVDVGKE